MESEGSSSEGSDLDIPQTYGEEQEEMEEEMEASRGEGIDGVEADGVNKIYSLPFISFFTYTQKNNCQI